MEPWLAAVETLGPVAALKRSFVAYPLVNALHVAAIGAVVTLAVVIDLRVLGRLPSLTPGAIATLRRLALTAFAVAVTSGLTLFAVSARDYAANPAFLAKLGLLGFAGLNFLIFGREMAGDGASPRLKRAAVASLVLWPATLVAGRFIGFL